jgi:hypothetical protein
VALGKVSAVAVLALEWQEKHADSLNDCLNVGQGWGWPLDQAVAHKHAVTHSGIAARLQHAAAGQLHGAELARHGGGHTQLAPVHRRIGD